MFIKLPSKVPTKIKAIINGLKPTSENARDKTPKKIKPITASRITIKTAKKA